MTQPLIINDRWPSRARRELRASDLGSLLNAIAGAQTTEGAAETDTTLRALEFISALPVTADQTPMFGIRLWGELFDTLIENAPEFLDYSPHSWQDMPSDSVPLPHLIEVSTSPFLVVLIWHNVPDQGTRREFYGTTLNNTKDTQLVFRKSFLDGKIISLAGEILRDCTTRIHATKTPKAAGAPPPNGLRSKSKQAAKPAPPTSEQTTHTPDSGQSRRVRGLPSSPSAER